MIDFANPVEVDAAIAAFVVAKTEGSGPYEDSRKVKNAGSHEWAAASAGAHAAKDVTLFHSVNSAEKQLAIA